MGGSGRAGRQRAAFFRAHAPADAPFHVGVLLDNIPEFWFTLCGAALAGATVVGINPTRRGAELGARHRAHRLRTLVDREVSARLVRRHRCGDRGRADVRGRRPRVVRRARTVRGRSVARGRPRADRPVHVDLHLGHHGRAEGCAHGSRTAWRPTAASSRRCSASARTTSAIRSCRSSIRTRRWRGSRTCWHPARPVCCAAASPRRTSCPTYAATA